MARQYIKLYKAAEDDADYIPEDESEFDDGQITIDEFIEATGLKMTLSEADHNPNMTDDDWSRTASHWLCKISNKKSWFTLYFSQGSAITNPPELRDVVDIMASDASGHEGRSFEEWAGDYGYPTNKWDDPDGYRDAKTTYKNIGKQSEKLKKLLTPEEWDELLYKTERL